MLTAAVSPAPVGPLDFSPASVVTRFVETVLAGDAVAAEALAEEALDAGVSPEAVQTQIIAPAMVRIGEMWKQGAMTATGEHLPTSISQRVLVRLFDAMTARSVPGPPRGRVLLAAVEGQFHVLGLRMIADVLECAGFDVLYLGEDVPIEALRRALAVHRPAVVGFSHCMPHGLEPLGKALAAVHELMPEPRVMLGGRAVPPVLRTAPYRQVASSSEVVDAVDALMAAPPASRDLPAEVECLRPAGARLMPPTWGPAHQDVMAARLARVAGDRTEIAREHIRRAAAFRDLALRDPLTGLLNLRGFDDRVDRWARQPGAGGSLLMIGVDAFKSFNDRFGHAVGDRVLRAIGRAISSSVRHSDFGARLGGDEFAVVLPSAGLEEARRVAERIRAAIPLQKDVPRARVSIGVAELGDDPAAMLLAADTALYAAKAAGRDRVVVTPRRLGDAA